MNSQKWCAAVIVTVVVLSAPCPARAEETNDWNLVGAFGTDFPLEVGGGLRLEMPYHLEVQGTVGFLPEGYSDVANDVGQQLGDYDDVTARLIDQTLQDALVFRGLVGWHPFGGGFFVQLGYSHIGVTGEVNLRDLANSFLPGSGLAGLLPGNPIVDGDADIDQLQGLVGYEWELGGNLVVRGALGFVYTFGASTHIDVGGLDLPAPADELIHQGEEYVASIFTDYFHVPTATVEIGYRFF